ncbi:hypothetical protein F8M41_012185 [Gigaspora margarita]|uniref:Uncharacterized protein n=1 Tax=Gigaspora margarita TaxID=4874 RepID=A0A8H3X162_GIGMA|nr:hypothetical protein F8M41_012185 [Gigaspora margarita]
MKVARYDDNEFYSALLLIFSNAFLRIKNKPIPIPLPNNNDNTNTTTNSYTTTNILPTKTTTIPSTTSTLTTKTPKPITTKLDFDLPKQPKNLSEPEEPTTNSSTTTILSITASTEVLSKIASILSKPTSYTVLANL